jgi:hypothetical protein
MESSFEQEPAQEQHKTVGATVRDTYLNFLAVHLYFFPLSECIFYNVHIYIWGI